MTDYWPHLHDDPYALARLKKSIELANVSDHHSVLDVGCHQEEARQFLPKGCRYLGLDHIKGDDFDGGFKLHRKFDRIICLEVLEHLKYPRKVLASIASHLAIDGICVISLPNEATLFHRLRGLFLGEMDGEAFGECGKHLHLPSLKQSQAFVAEYLLVVSVSSYMSLCVTGVKQKALAKILKILTPEPVLKFLAFFLPSLFARGFIFVCKKK